MTLPVLLATTRAPTPPSSFSDSDKDNDQYHPSSPRRHLPLRVRSSPSPTHTSSSTEVSQKGVASTSFTSYTPPKSSQAPSAFSSPDGASDIERLRGENPERKVLELCKDHMKGTLGCCEGCDWFSVPLLPTEYNRFKILLEEDEELYGYVENRLRYDYDASRKEFIFRTNTPIHEIFEGEVRDRVKEEYSRIKLEYPQFADIIERIQPVGHSRVDLEDGSRHGPDLQWMFRGAKWAPVVGEVSYSQSRKEPRRLADEYIVESEGSIQYVLGFDIEYRAKSKKTKRNNRSATVSVWRYCYEETQDGAWLVMSEEDPNNPADLLFRNPDGEPVKQGSLRIPLEAFIFKGLLEEQLYKLNETDRSLFYKQTIEIPYADLASSLDKAEDFAKMREQRGRGEGGSKATRIIKRRRDPTPEEPTPQKKKAQILRTKAEYERRSAKMAEKDEDYLDQ